MRVTAYTDPRCPYGFNAQRQDTQLLWHYGHAVEVERRMIVLDEHSVPYESRGFTREVFVRGNERLLLQYGMPMAATAPDRISSSFDACRAYVGARMHAPDRADLLLRSLRRRHFSGDGEVLDEPATVRAAAADAGIAEEALTGWLSDPEVERELRADMAAAREPLPEAVALAHKLSGGAGALRYSTATAVFEHAGARAVSPGFQPFAVHEVVIANLAPEIERRAAPESAEAALAWAPYPLATAEVAELRGIGIDVARAELEAAGGRFAPSGADGYWTRA